MSRAEHLRWCKDRALEYVDAGDLTNAQASFTSDLRKHPDTATHDAGELWVRLVLKGHLTDVAEVRQFIEEVM